MKRMIFIACLAAVNLAAAEYGPDMSVIKDLSVGGNATITGSLVVDGTSLSVGSTPASTGTIRVRNNGSMKYRNATDNGDFDFLAWSSGTIDIGGVSSSTINITNNATDKLNLVTGPVVASSSVQGAGFLSSSTGSADVAGYAFSADTNTGINRTAADTLGIQVGGAIVAKFSADSEYHSGNVGVGCTPTEKLDVFGNLRLSDAGNAFRIRMGGDDKIYFDSDDNLDGVYGKSIVIDAANYTVGVGCTPSSGKLQVAQAGGQVFVALTDTSNSNKTGKIIYDNDYFSYKNNSDTTLLYIASGGNVYNYANSEHWNVTSDGTLKEDIATISDAMTIIKSLRGVRYKWKDAEAEKRGENKTDKKKHTGFIAQEVEKVLPEWVTTDSDGVKSICVKGDTALFVEALKTLDDKIEALKTRVDALEKTNNKAGK